MARYNAWQNRSLIAAADMLDDDARREPRGAFWRSIHETLVHLLWGDLVWMARFDGWARPQVSLGESHEMIWDWDHFCDARATTDAEIRTWADGLTDGALQGELSWYSVAAGQEVSRPKWLLVTHFFNHQTHHRGQVHAMLTAAGATPGDTDLFLMPEDA
jgi:uncharacterized damage-inducible protein DinB